MRKKRRILLALLVISALAWGFYALMAPRPFVYEGKTLEAWLDEYTATYYSWNTALPQKDFLAHQERLQQIDRIVHGMGPSAVQPLISELQAKHRVQNVLHRFLSGRKLKFKWLQKFDNQCSIAINRPQAAAQFLLDIGPDAAPAIPVLLAFATDTNQMMRANAINALGCIHQQPDLAVPVLISALSNNWSMYYAIYGLGRFGTNAAAAAPALRQLVTASSNDASLRTSALEALAKIAPDSSLDLAMPYYLATLKDRSSMYRYGVILSLIKLGPRAKEAVPTLTDLAAQNGQMSMEAAYALKAIDPAAAAKIWDKVPRGADIDEKIIEEQPPPETQEAFEARVRQMGSNTLPYLIKLINERPADLNDHPDEFQKVTWALGDMGEAAHPAIPALTEATGDSRWFVHDPAKAALMRINRQPLLPIINELKDTSDSMEWGETALLVAEFGTNAAPAIPLVIEAMKDGDDIVLGHGAILLGSIHSRPEICLPVLLSLFDSPSRNAHQTAIIALTKFGEAARPVLPQITNVLLNDLDPWTRMWARHLVKQFSTNAPANAVAQ